MGHGPKCSTEGQTLNRVIRATDDGFDLEGDPRHAELVVEQLNLQSGKSVRLQAQIIQLMMKKTLTRHWIHLRLLPSAQLQHYATIWLLIDQISYFRSSSCAVK